MRTKLLLTGIAALLLATGAARTQEVDIHHGENIVMLLLEKADGQKYVSMLNTRETCADVLAVIEARSRAGKQTWMTLAQGKPERILNVICPGTPSNQCPPNVAGKTPESGKACRAQ
jgi:hypothetical protein